MERKQLEDVLIKKAMEDGEFKKQLMVDPKAAVEKLTGQKLSEKLEIKVLEETPTTIYLSLPTNELSDEDLDSASGGVFCFKCGTFIPI